MKIIKSKNMQESLLNIVLIVGGLFLIAALLHYGSNKNSQKDMMVSGGRLNPMPLAGAQQAGPSKPMPEGNGQPQMGAIEASSSDVFDSSFALVSGGAPSSGAAQQNKVMNPNDLLPKQQNANSATMNPVRNDLSGRNFLTPEKHIGINTVGNSLRNANLQLRSEPANPQQNVGPWQNTTMEPDTMRRPLEIGGN